MKKPLGSSGQTFVGRNEQLDQFHHCVQDILHGEPRAWLIQGEAGVGKTRFLKEIESVAKTNELQVFKGRCFEDLTLPYLPFTEALFPRLEQGFDDPESFYEDDLAMVRHLRRGSPPSPAATPEQADQDKLRLFLTILRAMVKLARQSPTLFIVDDLHWADQSSLDLFSYLAFALTDQVPVPLLILGTHRPVPSGTRLARAIARLEREPLYRSMVLPGLNEYELRHFLSSLGIPQPSQQLINDIDDITQGIPLFIQEIVHHLMQRGELQERGGYLIAVHTSLAAIQLPKNVKDAFAIRLQTLSEDCRRILTIASVLGERFTLDRLKTVCSEDENRLLDVLEEGLSQHVLNEEEPYFEFFHTLMRQAFYQTLSAARRRRIHRRIAEDLEQASSHDAEHHAMEVAHHLIGAGALADASKVLTYTREAGDQAFAMHAWSDAARYYEAALAAVKSRQLPHAERAELHYLAGMSHRRNVDVGPGLEHFKEAIRYFQRAEDTAGLAKALLQETRLQFFTPLPLGTLLDIQPLQDVLERLGETQPSLRGHIATVLAQVYRHARQPDAAKLMAENALEIGQEIQDDYLCADAGTSLGLAYIGNMQVQEALNTWRTALTHARRTADLELQTWASSRLPLSLTLLGRLDEAEQAAQEACDVTTKTQDWGEHSLVLYHLVSIAVAKGDFSTAEQRTQNTMRMVERSHYPWSGIRALPALACAHAWRGQVTEAETALDLLGSLTSPNAIMQHFANVFRLLTHAYADRPLVQSIASASEDVGESVSSDTYSLAPLCALIELGDYTQNTAVMEMPYTMLSTAFNRGVLFSTGWMFLIPRVLGIADTRHHRWDQAESRFLEAIETATRVGSRPELARSYLDYADLLLARDRLNHHSQATELAEKALAIFHELDMHPFVKRATQLMEERRTHYTTPLSITSDYRDILSTQTIELLQYTTKEYTKFLS